MVRGTRGTDELLQDLIWLCADQATPTNDEGGDACDAVLP